MAPHSNTLPQAQTESARAARATFFCTGEPSEMCQKGYARMNEFQAHESSYDHSHRMRLKEMKQLTKDTGGSLKPKSSANSEIQPIKLSTSKTATNSDAPKRKPVFRTIGSSNAEATAGPATLSGQLDVNNPSTANEENDPSGAVRNGWYSQRYDPMFITGCDASCDCGGEDRIPI